MMKALADWVYAMIACVFVGALLAYLILSARNGPFQVFLDFLVGQVLRF